jgi:hypothetical protein
VVVVVVVDLVVADLASPSSEAEELVLVAKEDTDFVAQSSE